MAERPYHPHNPFSDPNLSPPLHQVAGTSRPVSPLSPEARPSPSYISPSAHEFGSSSYQAAPTSPPAYERGPISPPVIVGASVLPSVKRVPVRSKGNFLSDEDDEDDEPPRRYESYGGGSQFERSTERLNIHRGNTVGSIRSATSRKPKYGGTLLTDAKICQN